MKSTDQWLNEYGQTHRNSVNQMIHMVCVPLIFWSLVALAWAAPAPQGMRPWLNWAVMIYIPVQVFYLRLGWRPGLLMLVLFSVCAAICQGLEILAWPLGRIAFIIFAVAWVGQFYGHKLEGAKPAFFDDLKFLLIGPLWTLSKLKDYTRISL